MDLSGAAEVFTLLTVGDGLVTQIPALIVSTAAGVIATRNNTEFSLGQQVGDQLKIHPKAIYFSAAVLFIFSVIPGLPKSPFLIIGSCLAFIAYRIEKNSELRKLEDKERETSEKEQAPDNLEDLLPLELIELEIGYGLVNFVDSEQNGDLLERITHIRKQFALDWGVIIPSVRIKDNLELKPGGYSLKIKGIDVAKGELLSDHFLAMDPGTVIEKIEGVETIEPVFGLPAVWITDDQRDEAQYNGYTVVDLSTVIATHLTEVLKSNLHELFGRQELVTILDNFKEQYPKVVNDLIPDILPLGTVLSVTKNLLKESVSIRDLRTILESLCDYGPTVKDRIILTEYVRQSLYRTISESIKNSENEIPLFSLDRSLEELIVQNMVDTDSGQQLSLDPQITQNVLNILNEKIEEATNLGEKMVLLCSPVVRPHFKKLTEKFIPNLVVISHNELGSDSKIKSLGTVRL